MAATPTRTGVATTIGCGALSAAMGAFYVIESVVAPITAHPGDAPAWLGALVGGVFFLGGLAAILTTVHARWSTRILNAVSFLIACGLSLTAAGVALGPGEHAIASPLMLLGPKVGQIGGRIAFGLFGLLAALIAGAIARQTLTPQPPPRS